MRVSFPAKREPIGLVRSDGKRLDGATLMPWEGGKFLALGASVIDTLALSCRVRSSEAACAAAEIAAE